MATARLRDRVESFEDRLETLFSELELAIKYDRPSILLVVYRSEFVRAEAEAALAEKLRGLGQAVVNYRVTGEADADVPMHLAAREDRAAAVYFVSGLQWGGGRDGALAYRALNIRREYFPDYRIRAVFWLTEKEGKALPFQAPDFWSFRHRTVEFVEAPEPERMIPLTHELTWREWETRASRQDADAKIKLRLTLLRDLPESDATTIARAELMYTLGGLYWVKGEYGKSLEFGERALQLAKQVGDVRLQSWCYSGLGATYRALRRYADAIATFQYAIDLDPKYAYPYNGLGNIYRDLGRHDDAIATYQRATELDPKFAYPHNGLGNVYRDLGRYDEAIAEYQRSIALDAGSAFPHYGLGNVYRALSHTNEAIAEYQLAIELEPGYASPYSGMGSVYLDLGRIDAALAAFQRATQLSPPDAATHSTLAGIYRKLGREAESAKHIELAGNLTTEVDEYDRACFESVSGKVDKALALLQTAIEKRPSRRDSARRDPDFDFIRDDPRFRALVGEREKEKEKEDL